MFILLWSNAFKARMSYQPKKSVHSISGRQVSYTFGFVVYEVCTADSGGVRVTWQKYLHLVAATRSSCWKIEFSRT